MPHDRERERLRFLQHSGWGDARRLALGEDASTRRYERLIRADTGEHVLLMDAPPNAEPPFLDGEASHAERLAAGWNASARLAACRIDAFAGIAGFLRDLGVTAPQVHHSDVEAGFAIVEDLGDALFAREIERGADEAVLYRAAAQTLGHIHNARAPQMVTGDGHDWHIRDYDALAFRVGADLFPEWYPTLDPQMTVSPQQRAAWSDIMAGLCDRLAGLPQVLLMRDYHAENLIWLPKRDGIARVGLLDFQDAVRGPAAWDLVMFLQDARRDVGPEARRTALDAWLETTGTAAADIEDDMALAGAVNALRILGIFARLIARDGKPRYKAFLAREWGHLLGNLEHPELGDLRKLLGDMVPDIERRAA